MDRAVRRWAQEATTSRPEIVRIGYFGSYARGDWGVGSDVDLVVVVDDCEQPFESRAAAWDTTGLPVPADLLVYTREEWARLTARPGFGRRVDAEAVWIR